MSPPRRLRSCPIGALLIGVLGLCARAQANVETLGPAPVHVVYLDPGEFSSGTTWTCRVARGDTLSEIAKRELGTTKRTSEIQRLNPGVDARALRVGQVLQMPPRHAGKGQPWLDFFVALPGGKAQPLLPDAPATLPMGPVRLFAVPHEHVSVLRRQAGAGALPESLLYTDPKVAHSDLVGVQAPPDRTPARAVTHLTVTALDGRTLALTVREQQLYGATGHRVPPADEAQESGSLLSPLLLVLAGLVVFALVALAARRLSAPESDGTRLP